MNESENNTSFKGFKMKIKEFVDRVRKARRSAGYSGTIATNLSVSSSQDLKEMRIKRVKKCRLCKHEETEMVTVRFYQPHRLTIFETALLFSLFAENRIPVDYAGFHKCIAGKRFIENLREVD